MPAIKLEAEDTLDARILRLEKLELLRGAEEEYALRYHAHTERGEHEQAKKAAEQGEKAHEAYQRGHNELREAMDRRLPRTARTSHAS